MAVSYDQALNFYKKNRNNFPGMTAGQAVEQIVSGGEIPVAPVEAAPGAIPVAAPVAAALAAAAPAPVPMEAPVPEAVPEAQPAAEYVGPNQAALRAYNLANPEAPPSAPAAKNAPVDYAAMARNAATQREREGLSINADIERTATIDPAIQELLTNRSKRYETELSDVDKDRKQATWMAVAQAGMKMAQSQSPYFMQALASGMEAGLDGYSEAKAKAAEKKARLQDAKEDLVLKAKELRDQVVREGIGARLAAQQGAAAKTALQKDALGLLVGETTAPDVIKSAKLGNDLTTANIAKAYDDINTNRARLTLARAAARNPGAGGGLSTKTINAQRGLIQSQINANKIEMEDFTIPRERKAKLAADNDRLRGQLSQLSDMLGYGMGMRGGMKMTEIK